MALLYLEKHYKDGSFKRDEVNINTAPRSLAWWGLGLANEQTVKNRVTRFFRWHQWGQDLTFQGGWQVKEKVGDVIQTFRRYTTSDSEDKAEQRLVLEWGDFR